MLGACTLDSSCPCVCVMMDWQVQVTFSAVAWLLGARCADALQVVFRQVLVLFLVASAWQVCWPVVSAVGTDSVSVMHP